MKKSKFKFKQIILYDVINAEEGHRSIAYRRLHSPHVTMRVRILLEHTVQNQSLIAFVYFSCFVDIKIQDALVNFSQFSIHERIIVLLIFNTDSEIMK